VGPIIPPPPSYGGYNHLGPNISNQFGGTSHSVTSGFQIPVGGQPQVEGESQVGGQPQVGGHNPVYRKYTSILQSQPWNFPFQGNKQSPGGKPPQVNFVPPNLGKPYVGFMNPTWGQDFQSNDPSQGILPNQPTQVDYLTQNPPPLNLTEPSNYLQTAYGPTGIPTRLPTQNY
jgi:hypothetical protein